MKRPAVKRPSTLSNATSGRMPDITPAQIKAVVLAVIGVCAAFGLPISQDKQDALMKMATFVPMILLLADAVIRHGRSRVLSNPEAMRELENPPTPYVNE